MTTWQSLMQGFADALSPINLLFALIGSIAGTLVGVLPGLGPTAAIAMLLPLTLMLPPAPALIMMAAIYYGAMYGGSTTAILINIPGEASSVPTAIDGYKLAQQGRAGPALGIAAVSSFVAGTLGIVGLTFFAPPLARVALMFGPPEYFALTFLGLSLIISLSGKNLVKGLIAAVIGLLTAMVGMDPLTGVTRLTFGSYELMAGIEFVPVIMGLFGLGEVLANLEANVKGIVREGKIEWLPTWRDIKDTTGTMFRSGIVGFFLGLIPGFSPSITSFMAYDFEKRISKNKAQFGEGAIQGVAAPEGANNATSSGGFVPLFAFGIPSGPALAVLLGGFMMYGLQPGPRLFQENPGLVWAIIASMYIGNVMLVILNLPLVGFWARLALIPFPVLAPLIVTFTIIGSYSIRYSMLDVLVVFIFGIIGYFMRKLNFPVAPLVLATVLAKMMETTYMQSMVLSHGSQTIFFTRPISLAFMAVAILFIVRGVWSQIGVGKFAPKPLVLEESE